MNVKKVPLEAGGGNDHPKRPIGLAVNRRPASTVNYIHGKWAMPGGSLRLTRGMEGGFCRSCFSQVK